MGLCPSGEMDSIIGGANDVATTPPQLATSPVVTALFAVIKTIVMFSLAPIFGPLIAIYGIVKSHWKFLERLDMVRLETRVLGERERALLLLQRLR